MKIYINLEKALKDGCCVLSEHSLYRLFVNHNTPALQQLTHKILWNQSDVFETIF